METLELPPTVLKTIEQLRSEAEEVKRCFTQFSFQAFAFSSVLLGLIARELSTHAYIGMSSLIVTFMLLMVKRIGNYKYTTANRNYGYEMHLHRALRYCPLEDPESTKRIINLGWEEAMFAWRIVQATIYETIYEKSGISRKVRERKESKGAKYHWWDTERLKGAACHHPGSYLNYMQMFLHWLAVVSMLPAVYSSWYYFNAGVIEEPATESAFFGWVFPLATLWVLAHVFLQRRRDDAQRSLLETKLLSIQSSAVVWRCAVVAHFRALEETHMFVGYTKALGEQAKNIVEDIEAVHRWLEKADSFPAKTPSDLRSVVGKTVIAVAPMQSTTFNSWAPNI